MSSGILPQLLGKIGRTKLRIQPHFHETYHQSDLRGEFHKPWADNSCSECAQDFQPREMFWSLSKHGTIRGFHFFNGPLPLNRLITVVQGEINDVIFERNDPNPIFKNFKLTRNSDSLFVPSHYAHGFEVVSDVAVVLYLTDVNYDPECDSGINWQIYDGWQIEEPILSSKDASLPFPTLADIYE